MSRISLAAILMLPLSLAPLRARAQMVPVAATEASTQSVFGDSSTKLYSTASHSGDGGAEAPAGEMVKDGAEDEGSAPLAVAGSLSRAEALPANAGAMEPAPSTLEPSALDPSALQPAALEPSARAPAGAAGGVTLPPKPAKVRDLPGLGGGDKVRVRPFRAVAFGVTASSLGAGGELAIPVARTLNVRVGASYVLWHYPFSVDGIDYNPGLKFTSGRATLDWFPHHGAFHVSAGALYFRNAIGGSADVVEGQSFSLGGTSYSNSVDDPIHGMATITYGKQIAPMVLLGFGNILPRSGRHLSMPFEFGGAYMEPPTLKLKLQGTACTTQGCFNAATDPQVQANLQKEVTTLQGDVRFLEVYPIVSLGLACRF